jgi:hypothetical protein
MKNLIKYQLIAILLMAYSCLYATDWNVTNHNFRVQKDVDASMSADLTENMATVYYRDTLFNFVNYHYNNISNYIVIRKIFHKGTVPNFEWDYKKEDFIENLTDFDNDAWQPAAVVFRDSLLLFVSDISSYGDGFLKYSVYKQNTGKWLTPVGVPGNFHGYTTSHGMAAVVLDDKLCVITHDHNQNVMIHWTKDLKTWNHFTTEVNINNSDGENDQLSAVSTFFTLDSKKKSKLVFAWLDSSKHPYTADYYFSDSVTLTHLRTNMITDITGFSSVALAVGTISCPSGCPDNCIPDPTSTHECVQAFLKKDEQDNDHIYHRIMRYQLQETDTEWRRIEKNLVPQNSPEHCWASREIPLTATILPVPDGKNIRQFMCLVYRGYDNWNYPMNVAWAETDKLVYKSETTQVLTDPAFTNYLGYIEGAPPFYLNKMPLATPYINDGNYHNISNLEFKSSNSTEINKKMSIENSTKTKTKMGGLNLNVSTAFGKIWGNGSTTTKEYSISAEANEFAFGYYLKFQPTVKRADYNLQDVQGHLLTTTSYFYMGDPAYDTEAVTLSDVDPSNPFSYTDSLRNINFDSYNNDYSSISWVPGAPQSSSVKITADHTKTISTKETVSIGKEFEFGEIFKIEIENESSFEWEMETKTSTENEVIATSNLNVFENIGDVAKLNYTWYWLLPSEDAAATNWWLHEGGEDQQTWCVTYQVTTCNTFGGVQYNRPCINNHKPHKTNANQTDQGGTGNQPGNTEAGQESSNGFSLSQNYPNPFKPATVIKYQIGTEDPQAVSGNQGCQTKLAIYNLSGQEVATLVDEWKAMGSYEVELDASQLAPGVYFYKMQSGSFRDVKKLILLK